MGRGDRGAEPGVVDEDVDLAESVHARLDERRTRVRIGHVGRDRDRALAHPLHQGGRLGEAVDATGSEHQVGACLCEALRERHTQAGRRARDDRHAAVESEQIQTGHRVRVGGSRPLSGSRRIDSPVRGYGVAGPHRS